MRTVVKILCTVFLCLASSSLAWAAGDQKTQNRTMLYTSLFGGFAWPGTIGVNPQTGLSDRDVNAGLIYGLKIGFTPPPAVTWVGWELEASRSSQGVQQLAAGYATSSNVDVTTVAFNFILRYPECRSNPMPVLVRASTGFIVMHSGDRTPRWASISWPVCDFRLLNGPRCSQNSSTIE